MINNLYLYIYFQIEIIQPTPDVYTPQKHDTSALNTTTPDADATLKRMYEICFVKILMYKYIYVFLWYISILTIDRVRCHSLLQPMIVTHWPLGYFNEILDK